MLFQYLLITLIGFFVAVTAVTLGRWFALKRKFLVSKKIPLVGGISMGLAFFLASFLVFYFYPVVPPKIIGILSGSGVILLMGVIDDIREVTVPFKVIFQMIAASIVIAFGAKINIGFLPESVDLAITVIWIFVITNAFNLLDVTDGLSAGTAFLAGISFFVISLFTGDISAGYLLLCFLGGVAAFLVYNFPPAKVYMGNAGSHFLGFFLAVTAILLQSPAQGSISVFFSVLLILGFPLFFTLFIMGIQARKGKSIFAKTNEHPAGRLYALGYSCRKALFIMLGYCFLFCAAGVMYSRVTVLAGLVILILLSREIMLFTVKLNKAGS
jgi:UDP-GlcNAc:undecaprenyl-phosphate/decaprenyl-phosphate GlcNAc-1-phosphate transferase